MVFRGISGPYFEMLNPLFITVADGVCLVSFPFPQNIHIPYIIINKKKDKLTKTYFI